jgi:hypothetical protein
VMMRRSRERKGRIGLLLTRMAGRADRPAGLGVKSRRR